MVVPGLVVLVPVLVLVLTLPSIYRASATVLLEGPTTPPDSERDAADGTLADRLDIASQRVTGRAALAEIIERFGLYPDRRQRTGLAAAVDAMRDDISIEVLGGGMADGRGVDGGSDSSARALAFVLSYDNTNAELARQVVEELVVLLYANLDLKAAPGSAADPSADSAALAAQIARLEAELAQLEEQYPGSLPEQLPRSHQLMQQADDGHQANERALRTLLERKALLESQLARVDPYLASAATDRERASSAAQLRELEARYPSLSARYSESHPDRLAMERAIAVLRREVEAATPPDLERQLQEQQAELAKARQRYTDLHPDVVKLQRAIVATEQQIAEARAVGQPTGASGAVAENATNPVYVQLRTQLEAVEAELENRLTQREHYLQQLTELEQQIAAAPEVQQEYERLRRRHADAVARYQEREAGGREGRTAASPGVAGGGERFTLIEPPNLPTRPARPNRALLLLIGLVCALAAGTGHAALREKLDRTVRGSRDVAAVLGAPPIAVIPRITSPAERSAHRRRRVWQAVGAVVAGLLIGATLRLL